MVAPRECCAFWDLGGFTTLAAPGIEFTANTEQASTSQTLTWQLIKLGLTYSPSGSLLKSVSCGELSGPTWRCRRVGTSSTGDFPGVVSDGSKSLLNTSAYLAFHLLLWICIFLVSQVCRGWSPVG